MIVRNETYRDNVCVEADCYDFELLTYTREEYGTVVIERKMTRDEWLALGPQPLDRFGSLMTLLVVRGFVGITEAANLAGVSEESLILEAQAWAAAEAGL